MHKEAQFEVSVTNSDGKKFAELSGDWNPLHTDPEYATTTVYGRQVLHGAFSAGLISRLAGMYLPGKDCLLYGIKLRFVNPILPPVSLVVYGKVVQDTNPVSRVEATVSNKITGELYVEASYEFGFHRMSEPIPTTLAGNTDEYVDHEEVVLVTGASGGLGAAVTRQLPGRARTLKRNVLSGRLTSEELIQELVSKKIKIAGIIHCAWPTPDARRFTGLNNPHEAIEQQVAGPLKDIQFLSSIIDQYGIINAPLILVGSTYAKTGRHYFRMPLYSIAKSTIPTIVDILALELASKQKRCYGVIFDVLDGGMNKGISEATKMANADRSPWGTLGTPDEAAKQIIWLLENQSKLVNGSIITLTGGAIP